MPKTTALVLVVLLGAGGRAWGVPAWRASGDLNTARYPLLSRDDGCPWEDEEV